MGTGKVEFHRVFKAPPEKAYRAFLEADAVAKWLPPFGYLCTVHHFDARVGGHFKMSFRSFTNGNSHSFGGEYLELIENQKIRYIDKFDDANLPGQMEVVVTLKPVSCGAELRVIQSGIPEAIPVEMCYLGWQESLEQLKTLIEANG